MIFPNKNQPAIWIAPWLWKAPWLPLSLDPRSRALARSCRQPEEFEGFRGKNEILVPKNGWFIRDNPIEMDDKYTGWAPPDMLVGS